MPMSLDDLVTAHPMITLSHIEYGRDFYLGRATNICTLPAQRVQTFVDTDRSPYRFLIVGRLMSFKVVEDSVWVFFSLICLCNMSRLNLAYVKIGHYLSAKIGRPLTSSGFTHVFWDQVATLQDIEDKDGVDDAMDAQVI
jgi:hypothetical protein